MNARQKAKMYKSMRDKLLRQPVIFNVNRSKTEKLRFERLFPVIPSGEEDALEYLQKVLIEDIARSLATDLYKYIRYTTEFDPNINRYRISGEVEVVV